MMLPAPASMQTSGSVRLPHTSSAYKTLTVCCRGPVAPAAQKNAGLYFDYEPVDRDAYKQVPKEKEQQASEFSWVRRAREDNSQQPGEYDRTQPRGSRSRSGKRLAQPRRAATTADAPARPSSAKQPPAQTPPSKATAPPAAAPAAAPAALKAVTSRPTTHTHIPTAPATVAAAHASPPSPQAVTRLQQSTPASQTPGTAPHAAPAAATPSPPVRTTPASAAAATAAAPTAQAATGTAVSAATAKPPPVPQAQARASTAAGMSVRKASLLQRMNAAPPTPTVPVPAAPAAAAAVSVSVPAITGAAAAAAAALAVTLPATPAAPPQSHAPLPQQPAAPAVPHQAAAPSPVPLQATSQADTSQQGPPATPAPTPPPTAAEAGLSEVGRSKPGEEREGEGQGEEEGVLTAPVAELLPPPMPSLPLPADTSQELSLEEQEVREILEVMLDADALEATQAAATAAEGGAGGQGSLQAEGAGGPLGQLLLEEQRGQQEFAEWMAQLLRNQAEAGEQEGDASVMETIAEVTASEQRVAQALSSGNQQLSEFAVLLESLQRVDNKAEEASFALDPADTLPEDQALAALAQSDPELHRLLVQGEQHLQWGPEDEEVMRAIDSLSRLGLAGEGAVPQGGVEDLDDWLNEEEISDQQLWDMAKVDPEIAALLKNDSLLGGDFDQLLKAGQQQEEEEEEAEEAVSGGEKGANGSDGEEEDEAQLAELFEAIDEDQDADEDAKQRAELQLKSMFNAAGQGGKGDPSSGTLVWKTNQGVTTTGRVKHLPPEQSVPLAPRPQRPSA